MTSLATTADRISRILYGVRRYASLVCIFGTALFASPSLHAQSVAQRVAQPVIEQTNSKLYTVKFDGGDVDSLKQKLKSAFPNDNVVIAPSARHFRLDPFEVRDVLLNELGRTIEFLSDGRLTVEVVERDKGAVGNFWRIGSKSVSTAAVTACSIMVNDC